MTIKYAARGISTQNTEICVRRVKSSGTFHKSVSATNWSTGISGIPSGWTVVNVAK